MTFLYTLTGATRKQKEKKKFSLLKFIQKSNVILKEIGFSIYFYVFGFSRCNGLIKRQETEHTAPKKSYRLKHFVFLVEPTMNEGRIPGIKSEINKNFKF